MACGEAFGASRDQFAETRRASHVHPRRQAQERILRLVARPRRPDSRHAEPETHARRQRYARFTRRREQVRDEAFQRFATVQTRVTEPIDEHASHMRIAGRHRMIRMRGQGRKHRLQRAAAVNVVPMNAMPVRNVMEIAIRRHRAPGRLRAGGVCAQEGQVGGPRRARHHQRLRRDGAPPAAQQLEARRERRLHHHHARRAEIQSELQILAAALVIEHPHLAVCAAVERIEAARQQRAVDHEPRLAGTDRISVREQAGNVEQPQVRSVRQRIDEHHSRAVLLDGGQQIGRLRTRRHVNLDERQRAQLIAGLEVDPGMQQHPVVRRQHFAQQEALDQRVGRHPRRGQQHARAIGIEPEQRRACELLRGGLGTAVTRIGHHVACSRVRERIDGTTLLRRRRAPGGKRGQGADQTVGRAQGRFLDRRLVPLQRIARQTPRLLAQGSGQRTGGIAARGNPVAAQQEIFHALHGRFQAACRIGPQLRVDHPCGAVTSRYRLQRSPQPAHADGGDSLSRAVRKLWYPGPFQISCSDCCEASPRVKLS